MTSAPKENPDRLELRAPPRPVMRLNRKIIVLMAGTLVVAVVLALMWGLRNPKSQNSNPAPEKRNVGRVAHAEGLEALPHDYGSLPKPPPLGAPSGELGRPVLRAEREAGIPELPEQPNFRPSAEEDAIRAQHLKEQGEADEASKAPVLVQLKTTRASTASTASVVSGEAAGVGGVSLTSEGGVHTVDMGSGAPAGIASLSQTGRAAAMDSDPNRQAHKQDFLSRRSDSNIYASASLQSPRSPFELMAGSIIPAALITGIQSDLPGQVTAQVTENIYDTASGQYLLIPQGAKLIGSYDSQVAFGQSRILLVWTRLIMPNGASMILDRLPAADTQGYAGLEDQVNWHWGRILAGAALATLLGISSELAASNQGDVNGNVVLALRDSSQDTANQVGQEITRRNLEIQPTLTERPGLPLRVVVTRDLVLKPYSST